MRHTYTAPYKLRMHSQRGLPTSTAACCIRKCQRSVRQFGRTRGEEQKKTTQKTKKKRIKYRTPQQFSSTELPLAIPLSQGDSCQLDEVSHTRSDDDGLLIRVAGLVVTLHLLHDKLGMAQQRVLGEAVEVESGGRHRRLREQRWIYMSNTPKETFTTMFGHLCRLSPRSCWEGPHRSLHGSSGGIPPQSCSCRSSLALGQRWAHTPRLTASGCNQQTLDVEGEQTKEITWESNEKYRAWNVGLKNL